MRRGRAPPLVCAAYPLSASKVEKRSSVSMVCTEVFSLGSTLLNDRPTRGSHTPSLPTCPSLMQEGHPYPPFVHPEPKDCGVKLTRPEGAQGGLPMLRQHDEEMISKIEVCLRCLPLSNLEQLCNAGVHSSCHWKLHSLCHSVPIRGSCYAMLQMLPHPWDVSLMCCVPGLIPLTCHLCTWCDRSAMSATFSGPW